MRPSLNFWSSFYRNRFCQKETLNRKPKGITELISYFLQNLDDTKTKQKKKPPLPLLVPIIMFTNEIGKLIIFLKNFVLHRWQTLKHTNFNYIKRVPKTLSSKNPLQLYLEVEVMGLRTENLIGDYKSGIQLLRVQSYLRTNFCTDVWNRRDPENMSGYYIFLTSIYLSTYCILRIGEVDLECIKIRKWTER